jgi:hypothetical protein
VDLIKKIRGACGSHERTARTCGLCHASRLRVRRVRSHPPVADQYASASGIVMSLACRSTAGGS